MSIEIECQYCGTVVIAERSSRKYCDDSCKTLACGKRRVDESIKERQIAEKKEEQRQIQEIKDKKEKEAEELKQKQEAEFDARLAELEAMISHMKETSSEPPSEKTITHDENEKSLSKTRKARKKRKKVEQQQGTFSISGFISGFNK
jgi:hypothetical protein